MNWPKYEMHDPMTLELDAEYQRNESWSQVGRIAKDFDPVKFMTVLVAREGSKKRVVEGKGRVLAAREAGLKLVPCLVYVSKGVQEEAQVFGDIDRNRRKLTGLARFRADLVGKKKRAVEIQKVVEEQGLKLGLDGEKGPEVVDCVSTLEKIWERDGRKGLKEILELVEEVWPGDPAGRQGRVLDGLSRFVESLGGKLDREELVRVLRKQGARRFSLEATEFGGNGGISVSGVMALIKWLYDRG